jgi:hypothetical protein
MTKIDWISKAGKLCLTLQKEVTNLPSSSIAKDYTEVRSVIMRDHHHDPNHTRCNILVVGVREWMTGAKNGNYDNRFTKQ